MTNKTIETSPQAYARIFGVLYLAVIVLGAFAEGFVTNKLVVPGDAETTAHNIMAGRSSIHDATPACTGINCAIA
jgi:hypothetical protein